MDTFTSPAETGRGSFRLLMMTQAASGAIPIFFENSPSISLTRGRHTPLKHMATYKRVIAVARRDSDEAYILPRSVLAVARNFAFDIARTRHRALCHEARLSRPLRSSGRANLVRGMTLPSELAQRRPPDCGDD
jgi:hypothetical protein